MNSRRDARRDPAARTRTAGSGMPPELLMGPCIEVWAQDFKPRHDYEKPWFQALRNWQRACDEWAAESGWATDRRPAATARNLARIRYPWSREFLIASGRADVATYYEHGGERIWDPPNHWVGHF